MAGAEIAIAGRTLIAESPRILELRNFCSRLLGWSDDRMDAVDQALRTIRLAAAGRVALVLRGRGDMVPVAFAIHRHTPGRAIPFLVSDPRRRDTSETARGPANCANAMGAIRQGFRGALCVRTERLPSEFGEILQAFQRPDGGIRMTACASGSARKVLFMSGAVIEIPSLDTRREELIRILSEYAVEAIELLDAPRGCLDSYDLEMLAQLPAPTLSEIEKAVQRVVAVKKSRNLSAAARWLQMAPVSLQRWLTRRAEVSKAIELYFRSLVSHWRRKRHP